MKKRNLRNAIKKYVAGMVLVCSLLTVFGSVSNEGVMPCVELVISEESKL